jgi:predicted ArsR family transcriptional regulator
MTEFDSEPTADTLAAEREEWNQTQDTRTRIRTVVTGLQEPAPTATIADRANCSTNAARKHLEEFVDLGIAHRIDDTTGTRYARNEAYFRWRRANELATGHTIDQLLDELEDLEARDEEFERRFDAATPAAVELPEDATHAELEDRIRTLSEWQTIRESIDRHKEALRIARREDGQLPA